MVPKLLDLKRPLEVCKGSPALTNRLRRFRSPLRLEQALASPRSVIAWRWFACSKDESTVERGYLGRNSELYTRLFCPETTCL